MNPPEPRIDVRPWGQELWLTQEGEATSMVKLITVRAGEALSLQFHKKRSETWTVVSGDGEAVIGKTTVPLHAGASCHIPRETVHRVIGGKMDLVFVETTEGDFDEKDIVRLEDRYGRV